MNIAGLAIKRPIFITCLFLLIVILGTLSMKRMPVDLFPDVTFPVVTVTTEYPGSAPREVETLISKPMEDEISTISGIKNLTSINKEGVSAVVIEFVLGTDIKDAEQQVRNHISIIRRNLPEDMKEPVITRVDPDNQPILKVALTADIKPGELYDLADKVISPRIQQVNQVGLVEILGGRKREVHVKLNLEQLREREISASQVSDKLALMGKNIPIGKVDQAKQEKVFRLVGEFPDLDSIRETIVSFMANDVPVKVSDLAEIEDTLEDEKSRTFISGKPTLILNIYKQSSSNTVAVADGVMAKVDQIAAELSPKYPKLELKVVQDLSQQIKDNVKDVKDSILIGIALTIIVVFFFLGNFRSTIITGLALPSSLLGAFILMSWAGFSFNVMSLLALSLAVGLLIDDAIVVRENIFRHMELGSPPLKAALEGTKEVALAVIATTFAILAVFGPIGFLQGVVGQFFKEFGLSICFAMAISLLDALTMAPMLSAYFAGNIHEHKAEPKGWTKPIGKMLQGFGRFQDGLEDRYERTLKVVLKRPLLSLSISFLVFILCVSSVAFIPKTFLPSQDFGEFLVKLESQPGTNLQEMTAQATRLDEVVRKNPEVADTVLTAGDKDGQSNVGSVYVRLVPRKERSINTTEMKEKLRTQFGEFKSIDPKITDVDMVGGGIRPFNVNIVGEDLDELEKFAMKAFDRLKDHPALLDPEISHKPGKPEVQVVLGDKSAEEFGLTTDMVGREVRALIEGELPAVFRENGKEYDIRVRAREEDRDLAKSFDQILVPNINLTQIPLNRISTLEDKMSPVAINRQNRGRYIQIAGDIRPGSVGMGGLIQDIQKMFETDLKLPPGISYTFVGQAEDFKDLMQNMMIALLLGIVFIYFVLASLYESFITPFTIMLVLPLAACGAFLALFVTQQSLDIFSMIGCILLMGVASKNSILLVDYTQHLMREGVNRTEAVIRAGRTRLRPILMTSLALIAGMIPVAIGLNEASKQRVSMGIAVIGGVLSSTLLTLVVIPASFAYVDRFNQWITGLFRKKVSHNLEVPDDIA